MVRQRHPPGAASRETHTLVPVNFGNPSDSLYGSQMDLEAVTVVDLGQGSVTDGAIVDGGLDGGTAIRDGTLPPAVLETDPPPDPDFIVTSPAGAVPVAIVVTLTPPAGGFPADYYATFLQYTSLSDNDPVTPHPDWLRPQTATMSKDQLVAYLIDVRGATQYWVRAYAVDQIGNATGWIPPTGGVGIMTASDIEPPDIPQDVNAAPGYKALGVRWTPTSTPDLMYNEVRFCRDASGSPDLNWTVRRTRSNSIYIDGLTPGSYWAQVRAVDYSQNVVARWPVTGLASTNVLSSEFHDFADGTQVALGDLSGGAGLEDISPLFVRDSAPGTFKLAATLGGAAIDFTTDLVGFLGYAPDRAVSHLVEDEAGWTPLVGPTPVSEIGVPDIAFDGIIASIIDTDELNAAWIKTGTLTIAATDAADGISVMYGSPAVEVGHWDEDGLYIRSKAAGRSLLDYIYIDGGFTTNPDYGPQLTVFKNGQPTTAITKDGIDASAINFGVAEGGHNLIWNSSFELSKFIASQTALIGEGGFTLAGGAGGWGNVAGGTANATLGAAAITMAAL